MAQEKTYTKIIKNHAKFTTEVSAFENYLSWQTSLDQLTIFFSEDITTEQEDALDEFIANWLDYNTVETLTIYLDSEVFPFIKNLMNVYAAENISMGITQAGKTDDVLGLFEKKHVISGSLHPVSLKAAFDTGSLYTALTVVQQIRDTPLEYVGLSPFVTDARLLEMKNKIETFLGLELSE